MSIALGHCACLLLLPAGMLAGRMVARLGAVETMVYTHLPSNVLLILVPLMPTAEAAVAMLIARNTISQMDVPARQAYVAWQVRADERSAAGGITTVARSLGLSLSPLLLGGITAAAPGSVVFDCPFYISGGLKIACAQSAAQHSAQHRLFSSLLLTSPCALMPSPLHVHVHVHVLCSTLLCSHRRLTLHRRFGGVASLPPWPRPWPGGRRRRNPVV